MICHTERRSLSAHRAAQPRKKMQRHPNNTEGRFWIDQDVCCVCGACFEIAPANVRGFDGDELSYVIKQPEDEIELEALRKAIYHCPVEAVIEDDE